MTQVLTLLISTLGGVHNTPCMKYPRGSSIALGVILGTVIGVLMDNVITFIALGLMFGLIGESANKSKNTEDEAS